ncbi:MAG: hypothetical protein RLZZ227_2377 [Pseudomonadota bacterium]|jgi:hypothetical protein
MQFNSIRAGLTRFIRTKSTLVLLSTLSLAVAQSAQAQTGGFLEQPLSLSTAVEPLLSQSEILSFLPQRGKFTFPAPYSTTGIRLTNATDCSGAQDCVDAVGYSYWRNINNHVGQDNLLVLVGLNQTRGGAGLTLMQVNKTTDAVTNLGLVFPAGSSYGGGSGEGWYFSATQATKMFLNSGAKILRHDVISKQTETVFDLSARMPGHIVWQVHTSNDDRVHSATIKNSAGASLGCMAYETDTREFHYYPKKGDFDECQIDKSGTWLVIKENVDGAEGEDNRIINIETGNERLLRDSDGAGGHSDLGYGYMVAADNWASASNTQRVWDFNAPAMTGLVAYANLDWNASMPAHLSHSNARNAPINQQFACGSSANRRNSAEANEVICFRLDGSKDVLVVAPVMTNLDTRGSDDYDNSPKGNLDITGQYFIWTSNMGGSRLDSFLVKIPSQLLTGTTSGGGIPTPVVSTTITAVPVIPVVTSILSPAPAPATSTSSSSAAVTWVEQVNVSASGGSLQKTGGCDGCTDSGAASQQVINGNGYVEFTATVESGMRGIGLNDKNTGTSGAEIDFGLRLQGGAAEVRENGLYRWDLAFANGDVFRISVANGVVKYAKNGTVFYTSTKMPAATLRADTTFASSGSRISNAVISTGTTSGTSTTTATSTSTSTITGLLPVTWTGLVNVATLNGSAQKNAGCDGCPDAGAVSSAQIASGEGYLEFKGTIENKLRVVGLSGINSTTTDADIRYGLRLENGSVEVREGGAFKWDTTFNAGDIFRISVQGGVVTYAKNGVVFYRSKVAPSYPLRADASFASTGGTVMNAVMKTGG